MDKVGQCVCLKVNINLSTGEQFNNWFQVPGCQVAHGNCHFIKYRTFIPLHFMTGIEKHCRIVSPYNSTLGKGEGMEGGGGGMGEAEGAREGGTGWKGKETTVGPQ